MGLEKTGVGHDRPFLFKSQEGTITKETSIAGTHVHGWALGGRVCPGMGEPMPLSFGFQGDFKRANL